jgi:argininosuccinate lyase
MKTLTTALNQKQENGFHELTHGIDVDVFLFKEEITVQKAWVTGLIEANIISVHDGNKINSELDSIEQEIENKTFNWVLEDEDIHMNIERVVTEKLGDLGKKMHLGRSRNDLVATSLKLYLANSCIYFITEINAIALVILDLSERDINIILPAYTHLQAAQPIRMSQIWNFHVLNFSSDFEKFYHCHQNLMSWMPLGSAAISGTHISIDLKAISKSLGFHNPPINSIHGVSDRDGVIETAQAISMLALHIGRFCEDIILMSSSVMKVAQLSPEWSSGSSIMPNKRNPDFFEVLRGKSKKLMALGNEVLFMNSGIASGYCSDFHEQKRVIVEAIVNLREILPIIKKAFGSVIIDKERSSELLSTGHILATDVANNMVTEGMTFRDAYRLVATRIVEANEKFIQVGTDTTSFETAVEKRNNFGGTSASRILESISTLKDRLLAPRSHPPFKLTGNSINFKA